MAAVFSNGLTLTYADTGGLDSAATFLDGEDDAVQIFAPKYDFELVDAPGVSGFGTKAFSYRGTKITMKAVYVNTSEANVISAWNTDSLAMAAVVFTLTLGGIAFTACILDSENSMLGRVRPVGLASATFYAKAIVVVNQIRLS